MNRTLPRLFVLCSLLVCCVTAVAQTPPPSNPPIADNSFLLEEAYNQEAGVVQHINAFTLLRNRDWGYSFTQEWPVRSVKHQFSFTAVGQRTGSNVSTQRGFGDLAINYRYQLVGDGNAKVAVAPRFSILLPTGDSRKGLGAGAVGYQMNLPVSVSHSKAIVTHWNAGSTLIPRAKNSIGDRANVHGYNLGQSTIWKTTPTFNVMFETYWSTSEDVIGRGRKNRNYTFLMNPGVRWAHNFKSGLQIVPGIAVPLGVGPSHGERGVFFYLSFEHPFKKQ